MWPRASGAPAVVPSAARSHQPAAAITRWLSTTLTWAVRGAIKQTELNNAGVTSPSCTVAAAKVTTMATNSTEGARTQRQTIEDHTALTDYDGSKPLGEISWNFPRLSTQ
ncbi:hypothetical protein FQR65_LT20165 [Abscondita terminalis]|nr:hypothetical protein FQR65_LT20165 [Abscondita terminalis]